MMTSRDRLLKAIHGEMPDRVPVTLFIVDGGHFINQIFPAIDFHDHEQVQLKVIEASKQFGADVFVRLLYGVNDPLSIHYGGLHTCYQTDGWEVRTEEIRTEDTTIWRSTIRTPGGSLTQDFSRTEVRTGTFIYGCTKKPIETEKDLDLAIQYEPKMPEYWKRRVKERISRIKGALGDDGILGTWVPPAPFCTASLLIDTNTLYSIFRTDPGFYEKLIDFAIERSLDYMQAIDQADVDVHVVGGGNVCGGFLGRHNYETYILPFERKYINFVQSGGKPAVYHNCGLIAALVESYKQLGAKIVEPFSPAPLGDADLAKVKKTVDGAYTMISGVDQVNVLQKGSADDVHRATREAMLAGKPGGKFIMQNVDFLEYGTPEENVRAFVEEALEHAAY